MCSAILAGAMYTVRTNRVTEGGGEAFFFLLLASPNGWQGAKLPRVLYWRRLGRIPPACRLSGGKPNIFGVLAVFY